MAEHLDSESLAHHLFYGMLLVVGLAAFTSVGTTYGWLSGLETIGLDSLMRLHSHKVDPSIAIVSITDEDYEDVFSSTSPLDKKILEDIIVSVASAHPAVIAVDLDIATREDPLGQKYALHVAHEVAAKNLGAPPIVWPYLPFTGAHRSVGDANPIHSVSFGVPRFPRDSDGPVRRFFREVIDREDCTRWPSFPFQIYSVQRGNPMPAERAVCPGEAPSDPTLLRFSTEKHPFYEIDAANLRLTPLPADYAGKTILIGGRYRAARDTYDTSVGELSGVDLVAYAVSALYQGASITFARKATGVALDLVLGLAILAVSYCMKQASQAPPPSITIGISVLIALVAPTLCSFIVFHSGYYWIGFAPAILGAFLHISYDGLKDLRKLEKEVLELRRRLDQADAASQASTLSDEAAC